MVRYVIWIIAQSYASKCCIHLYGTYNFLKCVTHVQGKSCVKMVYKLHVTCVSLKMIDCMLFNNPLNFLLI